jgi:DNA-binding MarR family transcriptional regulator
MTQTNNAKSTREITSEQLRTLAKVAAGVSTVRELATATKASYSTVNGRVLALYDKEYIEFQNPDLDAKVNQGRRGRKAFKIAITAAGKGALKRLS